MILPNSLLRSPNLHAAALGLIVGFPVLTLACLAQTSLWPEIGPSGDLALHELAVWHAVQEHRPPGWRRTIGSCIPARLTTIYTCRCIG